MGSIPKFEYIPPIEDLANATTAISSVALGTGGKVDIPTWPISPSVFPNDMDSLKLLNWMAQPNQDQVREDLTKYYKTLSEITSGVVQDIDLHNLKQLLPRIKPYVLTEEDYNLLAASLTNVETYIIKYLHDDLFEKAAQLDGFFTELLKQLNLWINEANGAIVSDTYYNTNVQNINGSAPMVNGIAVDFPA